MGYIQLAQDWDQQQSLMCTVMNIRGFTKTEEYLDHPRDCGGQNSTGMQFC